MFLTFLSKSSSLTFKKSDATMHLLSMYTPALDTPMPSTRPPCSMIFAAAVDSAAMMPSKW